MEKRAKRIRDTLRHIGFKSIAMALAVFFITISMAVYVGIRFYETEKDVLLLQGKLNAKESAMEYNRYLHTRVDIVTLVGYKVDALIASGGSNQEIEEYLTKETEFIMATLAPNSTGLYGWIRGEYLDGAGWVPDEDYVATERPWYTQALQSDQKITVIEPYLDLNTQSIMMTIATLLQDGQSVVAMDISMDPIELIVEHISSSTEGSEAFVLDSNGIVVISSDENELGKNYLENPNSVGGIAARKLLRDGQTQFDIETAGSDYSVYVDALEGGWYSVSLINADSWYRPLQRTTILFAVILALLAAFLVLVFLRLSAKNLALQELHTRIDQEEKRGEHLQMLSETDRMTGLNDRVSGKRKVEELLSSGFGGMFLELDIDHFKNINDSLGHITGDLVILALADALRGTFRAQDVVMRLGGDEFGIFAVGIEERQMGENIINRLFSQIEKIVLPELKGRRICISVGAALTADCDELSFDTLYHRADSAMYESKKTKGNALSFHWE